MKDLIFTNTYKKEELTSYNPLVFAFVGDALHTLFVRNHVLKLGNTLVKDQHKKSIALCNAKTQATTLDRIIKSLSEEEIAIVKRARNTKTTHSAKNASDEEYKKSTSFEALLGWHYLQGNTERVEFLLRNSVE